MQWPIVKVEEAYEIIDGDRGKNYPKSDEFEEVGYCLFLSAANVTKDGFKFDHCQFITAEKDSLLRTGKLQRFDLVVTTRGTVGNIAYYDSAIPYDHVRINSGMVILRSRIKIDERFFIEQFKNPRVYKSLISGSAQPQMPIKNMKNATIIMPPITLQEQFSALIKQVDKSKFAFVVA